MADLESSSEMLSSQELGRGHFVSGLALWQWRTEARQQAAAAEIPLSEVDWLLQELAGLDRLALRLESFKDRAEIPLQRSLPELAQLWQQRVQGRVPVQYLTGTTPWRQFQLQVSPAVLIPRPETECLIELAIAAAEQQQDVSSPLAAGTWADLGTGSGAIALGLAMAFPKAAIHAMDYSAAALAIARTNAQTYHFTDRIQFYQGSWLEPLEFLRGQLSGIVSNPPYIPSQMVLELQPEVTWHEPHLALDGGSDGLDCIRHLIAIAPDFLQSGGVLLFEMMAGQATAVTELLENQGAYRHIQIHPDLAGIYRFAMAFCA